MTAVDIDDIALSKNAFAFHLKSRFTQSRGEFIDGKLFSYPKQMDSDKRLEIWPWLYLGQ